MNQYVNPGEDTRGQEPDPFHAQAMDKKEIALEAKKLETVNCPWQIEPEPPVETRVLVFYREQVLMARRWAEYHRDSETETSHWTITDPDEYEDVSVKDVQMLWRPLPPGPHEKSAVSVLNQQNIANQEQLGKIIAGLEDQIAEYKAIIKKAAKILEEK